jgi:hypothetical protein
MFKVIPISQIPGPKSKYRMAGTEGTNAYRVVALTDMGKVGFRALSGGTVRVRVEPVNGSKLGRSFKSNWKKPGQDGQHRFSTVVEGEKAIKNALAIALKAVGAGDMDATIHPKTPIWVKNLIV